MFQLTTHFPPTEITLTTKGPTCYTNLSATYTNSSLIPKVYKGQRTPRVSEQTTNQNTHPRYEDKVAHLHITQKDFRYPQTSARSECTQRTKSSLHNPQIRIKQYRTRIREGNGSTWMRDFTIDRNHTISCRHWASSTFKFPTYRETSESTNKDSTLNLSSTHRQYRCRLYYRKGRWTGKSSFQHLSNTTHFYRPTSKLNKQPSEMDFIGNHRKTTFVHLQIST